jgi:meso-butanediol dehydrogenase/(S,S)-butanediol dehydrogenase/diacetyl reductase
VIPGVGRPGDVAALIAFLLSDNARNISGAVYTMDGGLTVH